MKIIDNFLPEEDFKILQKIVMGKTIPWYYAKETNTGAKELSDFYFFHNLFDIHPLSDLYTIFLDKLITKINMFALKRAKLNCYPWSENLIKHKFHIDYQVKHKALILYFNTCNGFTMFKDNIKIESKENRALLFDGSELHRSTNCTDDKARFNININYI
jgi:hypothetical protein|tara:strand:- start:60 stop:539 length:480 start_codon:yes stop_codon:yes gene_type:complete